MAILCSGFVLCVFVFLTTGCEKSTEPSNPSSTKSKAESAPTSFQDKFCDVSVGNDENVWVVGYHGGILHSDDAGKHWVRQDSGTTNDLLGVSFRNDREGWVDSLIYCAILL